MSEPLHILQYQMFNQTFVNFVKQYFLFKKDEWLTEDDVIKDMPSVYKNKELVSPAIQFLYRSNMLSYNNNGTYKISQYAIDDLAYEKEKETYYFDKLKVDLKNSVRVYESYTVTRVFAWIGAFSGVILLIVELGVWLGWWSRL